MIEKWCDLNGPRVLIRASDPSLLTSMWDGWLLPEGQPAGSADFTLTIVHGEVAEPPEAEALLYEGTMPDQQHCIIRQVGDNEHYEMDGRASLLLGKREGLLTISPGNEHLARGSAAFQSINAALTLSDQYFLHAASLLVPGSDSCILIFGQSGAGKTTTTLSLLPAGFGLVTDDASVITRHPEGDRVWGMRLPLKVHERTATMLPWLAPLITDKWSDEREQPIKPVDLSKLLDIELPERRARPIAAIIILASRSDGDHRIRPLTRSEMLLAIANDNIGRSLIGVTEQHQARMKRIAELVMAAPAYEINAGVDLTSLPDALLASLN